MPFLLKKYALLGNVLYEQYAYLIIKTNYVVYVGILYQIKMGKTMIILQ